MLGVKFGSKVSSKFKKTRSTAPIVLLQTVGLALLAPAWAANGAPANDLETQAKRLMIEETLVNCYKDKGDVLSASQEFAKLIKLKPNDARAHFDYANLLLRLQKGPQAAAEFMKAQHLEPATREYLAGAGAACMINRNYDGAVLYYTKGIAMGGPYQTQLQQAQQYQAQNKQLQEYKKRIQQQQPAPTSGAKKGAAANDDDD